ncbi:hypothetical protein A9W99_17795 [Mycobacterium sp. 1164966.3]|nr:hypothetical protein A9W99_17795 [Mycobacterium sp. 1164966.3]
MPAHSEPLDPFDLCLSELSEAFYPIKVVGDDTIPIVHSKPIVERGFPSRPRDFYMLPEANLG